MLGMWLSDLVWTGNRAAMLFDFWLAYYIAVVHSRIGNYSSALIVLWLRIALQATGWPRLALPAMRWLRLVSKVIGCAMKQKLELSNSLLRVKAVNGG